MSNDEEARPAAARRRPAHPDQADYEALAEFRYQIRCFLEFSQNRARAVGLTPRQHQALPAIRGFGGGRPTTVGDLAESCGSGTTAPPSWSIAWPRPVSSRAATTPAISAASFST